MKVAVEQLFTGSLSFGTTYDANRVTGTTQIRQWNLGSNPSDRFVGPMPTITLRPNEATQAIPPIGPYVVQRSPMEWWLFYGDNAATAATRRIGLYRFNPTTGSASWVGFVTVTFPTATNHTVRGLKMTYDTYTVGTVAVSGTGVTGTGSAWSTSRLAVGSRIGFGSTDPSQITTWFQVSAIGSDTSITLTASAGTIGAGTAYVIEDLRAVIVTTNATTTNGGLFVCKGLRPEIFVSGGTTIPAATTVDNIRACYWIRDAATILNTVASGVVPEARTSWTSQFATVIDGAGTNLRLFRYNLRAALTLTAGAATLTGDDLIVTGTQVVTGNISPLNNGDLATTNHGPGSGISSIYLATTTRILRIALSGVVNASTTFLSDQMTENPPGGTTTFAVIGGFNGVSYCSTMDRFVVPANNRCYLTQYRTDGGQIDHIFLVNHLQIDQGAASAAYFPFLHFPSASSVYTENGYLFAANSGTTNPNSLLYIHPIASDLNFLSVTDNRAILPKITLGSNVSAFYRVYTTSVDGQGGNTFAERSADTFYVQYRTSGIDDNSGAWTTVPVTGNLTGVSAASAIQFALVFRTMTDVPYPARVTALCLVYETDDDLPSQYQWNFDDSSSATGTFGFTQVALFGTTPGVHTFEIYRSDTNGLVLTQASSGTTNGVFEFWNGSAWVAGLSTDTVGLRRRFRPTAGLPSGIDLYAKLRVA